MRIYKSKAFSKWAAQEGLSNVKADELKALRRYAAELMSYSKTELDKALKFGALVEVKKHG